LYIDNCIVESIYRLIYVQYGERHTRD